MIKWILLTNFLLLSNIDIIATNDSKSSKHVEKINCSKDNCDGERGICINNNCECNYGYMSIVTEEAVKINSKQSFCKYKQHSKIIAFFLEFFFPIGAGHFYTGKYTLALVKLLLFSTFFFFICGDTCFLKCKLSAVNKCHVYIAIAIVLDLIVWLCLHVFDLFSYAFSFYKDGNGINLIS